VTAIDPDVILLDEPCSALDPIASGVVEDMILSLRSHFTVVIVTHNLAQARRVADDVAFFWMRAAFVKISADQNGEEDRGKNSRRDGQAINKVWLRLREHCATSVAREQQMIIHGALSMRQGGGVSRPSGA